MTVALRHRCHLKTPVAQTTDGEGRWTDRYVEKVVFGRVELSGMTEAADLSGVAFAGDGTTTFATAVIPFTSSFPVNHSTVITVTGSGPADGDWEVTATQRTRIHLRLRLRSRAR